MSCGVVVYDGRKRPGATVTRQFKPMELDDPRTLVSPYMSIGYGMTIVKNLAWVVTIGVIIQPFAAIGWSITWSRSGLISVRVMRSVWRGERERIGAEGFIRPVIAYNSGSQARLGNLCSLTARCWPCSRLK